MFSDVIDSSCFSSFFSRFVMMQCYESKIKNANSDNNCCCLRRKYRMKRYTSVLVIAKRIFSSVSHVVLYLLYIQLFFFFNILFIDYTAFVNIAHICASTFIVYCHLDIVLPFFILYILANMRYYFCVVYFCLLNSYFLFLFILL